MKINLKKCNLGGSLIFISSLLSVISLFMNWIDAGITKASGIEQQGYLLLILYIYPVYKLFKKEKINKIIGLPLGILSIICGVLYLTHKNINFFGQSINVAGMGLYLFIISSVILTLGIYKYNTNNT